MAQLQTYRGVYLWKYVPSLPGSIVFTVLFALVTAAHGWRMVQTKMWFCAPFLLGGICEVVGYVCRAAAYDATGSLPLYLVQAIFILLPPALFAASLYMVYSRVVRAVQGERFSLLPPKWTTAIFVIGDLLCLNIQSGGAGALGKPSTVQLGNNIIISGLILQVVIFIGFMYVCLNFHMKFRTHEAGMGTPSEIPWESCFNMLYATSMAILVRNIFRVVEFMMGQDSYLFLNEWTAFVFDGALMFLVMVAFFVWYPSQLQPNAERLPRDSRDSMMELTDGANSAGAGRAGKHSGSTS